MWAGKSDPVFLAVFISIFLPSLLSAGSVVFNMGVSKSIFASFIVFAALQSSDAQAEEKGVLGAGIIVGEPTGISLKYYLGDDTAIDAGLGGAFIGKGMQVHADFLWHPLVLETKPSFVLPAYVGIGVRALDRRGGGGEEDHLRLGVRGVGGILFDFIEAPIDVFLEVAGIVDYRTKGDAFGIDINLGAGARYYF